MGVCLGGVLDLVEGAFWLQESKRPRVMRGHEKMMSGHEAAKREEDGDKSVEGGGGRLRGKHLRESNVFPRTFGEINIKCFSET